MYRVYDRWPDLAQEFYDMKFDLIDFKEVDHIIFTGMGGSGAVGDTLSSILSKTNIYVSTVRGFHLPNTADSNTLVIATSASGNTLETLTVLDRANKCGCKIIAFSSGGNMQKYCEKNKITFRSIPIMNSPRASFSIYLYSILNVLNDLIPVKKSEVKESITQLKNLQKRISSSNLTEKNPSLALAEWISGMPMIYYPWGLQAAAVRFKNSLQENAKVHAMAEDVIETCHNGIVSWEKLSNVQPILLQGKDDYIKTKKLWKIIKEYFEINKIDYREIYSVEGTILSKLINLVYLLDYTSIYYAITIKRDPTPIKSINFVKSRLK